MPPSSRSPVKIAVLGANGQVGSETCLYLRRYPDVEVVPISRSLPNSVLLRRCGFSPRIGSLKDEAAARELIGDCEVVVDFTLPKGTTEQMRATNEQIIRSALLGGDRLKTYVYMSTMAVHRLQRDDPIYRAYGATKRHAEKYMLKTARAAGKEAYVLRLAQVHGEVQSVSRNSLRDLAGRPGVPATVVSGPSCTVFVFSVAEAIRKAALREFAPGTYTLISEPSWSWRDIHTYYAGRLGVEPLVVERPPPRGRFQHHVLSGVMAALRHELGQWAYRNRDIVDFLLGKLSPSLQLGLRVKNARARMARGIATDPALKPWTPYLAAFVVPGRRIPGLTDTRAGMETAAAEVRALLDRVHLAP